VTFPSWKLTFKFLLQLVGILYAYHSFVISASVGLQSSAEDEDFRSKLINIAENLLKQQNAHQVANVCRK
jgi:hypothetical protein